MSICSAGRAFFTARGLMATPTLFTKRDFLLRVPFRDGLKKHQDWDWVIRAASQDGVGFDFESRPTGNLLPGPNPAGNQQFKMIGASRCLGLRR